MNIGSESRYDKKAKNERMIDGLFLSGEGSHANKRKGQYTGLLPYSKFKYTF